MDKKTSQQPNKEVSKEVSGEKRERRQILLTFKNSGPEKELYEWLIAKFNTAAYIKEQLHNIQTLGAIRSDELIREMPKPSVQNQIEMQNAFPQIQQAEPSPLPIVNEVFNPNIAVESKTPETIVKNEIPEEPALKKPKRKVAGLGL